MRSLQGQKQTERGSLMDSTLTKPYAARVGTFLGQVANEHLRGRG